MKPSVFVQLLEDPQKGERDYSRFLIKHNGKFDNAISIRFSAKKYENVDVSAVFYDNFKEFIIQDLSLIGDDVPDDRDDNWVYDLAERRIKKIRPEVNKKLAKILTQMGGAKNWGLACEIVYKEYQNVFKKVVSDYFRDDIYRGHGQEIVNILFQRFYLSRVNATPIAFIENYEGWLYICLRHLANRVRKEIDQEIIIRDGNNISLDSILEKITQAAESSPSPDSTDKVPNNVTDGLIEDPDPDWAHALLERYLRLIPNPKYAELIRAIKLEGIPVETMAEEWKCSIAAIYNMMNEAMTALVRVALPEIRKRNLKKYKKSQSYFKAHPEDKELTDYEKKILKEFFEDGKKVEELAIKHHRIQSVMAANLRKALNTMYQCIQTMEAEEYFSEDEEIEQI